MAHPYIHTHEQMKKQHRRTKRRIIGGRREFLLKPVLNKRLESRRRRMSTKALLREFRYG